MQFPLVVIGGPPHSGKSVLSYHLSQALRAQKRAHYLFRAMPDGEGDWSYEVKDPDYAQQLRQKGHFSEQFVGRIESALANPIGPLLVDVGGRPKADQEALFRYCTHAVVLVGDHPDNPNYYPENRSHWLRIMAEQNVPLIADLRSLLQGDGEVLVEGNVIHGTLVGLEREARQIAGDAFSVLVARLLELFATTEDEMAEYQLSMLPTKEMVNLTLLGHHWSEDGYWQPAHLPRLQQLIPQKEAVSSYGRAPTWAYATLAAHTYPAPFYLFDYALGWVSPPQLPYQTEQAIKSHQEGWSAQWVHRANYLCLTMSTGGQRLTIEEPECLPLPIMQDIGEGVVLDGRVPNWLMCAVVRQLLPYQPSWLAVHQPQLNGAVVIYSQITNYPVGHLILGEFGDQGGGDTRL